MKTRFKFYFLSFIFFHLMMKLNAQIQCGTITPSSHAFTTAPAQIAFSLLPHYDVPIHVYFLTNQGALPDANGSTSKIAYLRNSLNVANSNNAFGGANMKFYLSDVTLLESSTLYNNGDQLDNLYNLMHDDNAANLYIANALGNTGFGGIAKLPLIGTAPNNVMAVTISADPVSATLAHELGHHFNLLHTFENTFPSNWNDVVNNCTSFGDKICDTGPHIDGIVNSSNCSSFCLSNACDCSNSEQICLLTLGQNQYSMHLNKSNIMSYSFCERNKLTTKQKEVVYNELQTNQYRAHLIQGANPSEVKLPADKGYFYRTNNLGVSPVVSLLGDFPVQLVKDNNPPITSNTQTQGGFYSVDKGNLLPTPSSQVTITPTRTAGSGFWSSTNGVTTFDRIQIQKHILETELLPAPFARIAADVTNDGNITTADNIQIQKLIIGQITDFTSVPAWRFVPSFALQNQVFLGEFNSDPFSAIWTTSSGEYLGYNQAITGGTKTYFDDLVINLRHTDIDKTTSFSFEAIKSGDVNFSAEVNLAEPAFSQAELRTDEKYKLQELEHACLEPGKTYSISIGAKGDNSIYGYQMGINFNPNVISVTGVDNGQAKYFSLDNFNLSSLNKGELKTAWLDIETNEKINVSEKKDLFKMFVTPKARVCDLGQAFHLNDKTLENLFYDENGRLADVQLFITTEESKKEETNELLVNVFPNPTSGEVNFELSVHTKTNLEITLRDNFGKVTNLKRTVESNTNKITVEKEVQALAKGIIYYTILIGSKVYSGTFFKL